MFYCSFTWKNALEYEIPPLLVLFIYHQTSTQQICAHRQVGYAFSEIEKTISGFHTVIETRVEVWENEKLKWEQQTVGRVFPRYFEFSQTSIECFYNEWEHG